MKKMTKGHPEGVARRILFFITIGLFLWSQPSAYGHDSRLPKLVEVGISAVFIPTGFDDNDDVEVILEGFFPNTCYQVAPAKVEKTDDHKILITPRAYFYQGACLQTLVHYKNIVGMRDQIGFLNEGSYEVVIKGLPISFPLSIHHSHNDGPDDFIYAPIKEVNVVSFEPFTLRIKGDFLDSCFSMDRIEILPPVNNVISILPIVKYEKKVSCVKVVKLFEMDIPIEERLGQKLEGRYLFHIRSMEGMSKNLLENL